MRRIALFLIVITLAAANVWGLGVAPAKKVIDFTPGLEETYEYRIYNSDAEDMTIRLEVQGDIEEYVKLDKEIIEFDSHEQMKEFRMHVTLPEELSEDIGGKILISSGRGGEAIGATVNLIARISINAPDEITGAAVSEPEESDKNDLLMGLLIAVITLLVAGNAIYFIAARFMGRDDLETLKTKEKSLLHTANSLTDLSRVIAEVEDDEFSRMVRENEIYRYVRDEMRVPELAARIFNAKDKQGIIRHIEDHRQEVIRQEKSVETEIIEKELHNLRKANK